MTNYLLAIGGVILLVGGLVAHYRIKTTLGIRRICGLVSYAGLCMLAIGGLSLLMPVFTSIFGEYGVRARTVTQVIVFIAGAELILKPVFEDELFKDEEKILTPHGIKRKKKNKK